MSDLFIVLSWVLVMFSGRGKKYSQSKYHSFLNLSRRHRFTCISKAKLCLPRLGVARCLLPGVCVCLSQLLNPVSVFTHIVLDSDVYSYLGIFGSLNFMYEFF